MSDNAEPAYGDPLEDPRWKMPPIPSLVECVCARPKMYTPGGTLGEVVAFLRGYYRGLRERSSPWPRDDAKAWDAFSTWLASELGPDCWQTLRHEFNNEESAVRRLASLFLEHCGRGSG